MTTTLARIISRHEKYIVILWTLMLVLSLPLANNLEKVLIYTESKLLPGNVESIRVSRILAEEFPEVCKTGIVVVIKHDIKDQTLKSFVSEFKEKALYELSEVKEVFSIYDVYDKILSFYWDFMNKTRDQIYRTAPNMTLSLHKMLYLIYNNLIRLNKIFFIYKTISLALENTIICFTNINPIMTFIIVLKEVNSFQNLALKKKLIIELFTRLVGKDLPKKVLEKVYDISFKNKEELTFITFNLAKEILNREGYHVEESTLKEIFNIGPYPSKDIIEATAKKLAEEMMNNILKRYPPPKFPEEIPHKYKSLLVNQYYNVSLIYLFFREEYDTKEAKNDVRRARSLLNDLASSYNLSLEYHVTGILAFQVDIEDITSKDVKRIDQVTVALVVVLLVLLLSSLFAPIVPLISVIYAIIVSFAILYLIGSYLIDIHYFTRNLVTPLLMGVGVDYSMYILYRFKEELSKGKDVKDAISDTVRFAGEGVLNAALTVMVGFGALSASTFALLRNLGITIVIPVFLALLTALTFTPSILSLIGPRVFWPSRKQKTGVRTSYLRLTAEYAVKKPKLVIVIFILITVVSLIPLMNLRRTYDYLELMPEVDSIKGFKVLSKELGSELISRIYIVVDFKNNILVSEGKLHEKAYNTLKEVLNKIRNIVDSRNITVLSAISPEGNLLPYNEVTNYNVTQFVGKSGKLSLITVGIPHSPFSYEAISIVRKLRENLKSISDVTILVGGESASTADLSSLVDREFIYQIIPVALIGIFVVLYILTRSIPVSLALIAAIGTSVSWSLALLTVVFQSIIGKDVYWLIPIMLVTVLIGLGMDYGIFLLARVKEEIMKEGDKLRGIVKGVETTGLVITACGIIMAAALGSLVLSKMVTLQEIGFSLASAILMDTFLVRTLFLPSILSLTGLPTRKAGKRRN